MEFCNFKELFTLVKGKENRVVVPGANNAEALQAIKMADDNGLISKGILIGDENLVKSMVKDAGLNENKFEFVHETDVPTMCQIAVDKIVAGEGDFLVKGLVDTKYYMKAILNKDANLVPEGNLLTHFVLYQTPKYKKMFVVTDSAILISPTLEQKVKIINNAVSVLNKLGIEKPKISIVCPVEKVNPKIQSTLDAQELVKLNEQGEIKNCTIEGPYDIYMSFSKELAEEKGIVGKEIPGDVDVILLPDLDAANPLYKALNFFGDNVKSATILAGSKVPVILPSRADAPEVKLNSIALSSYLKGKK